MSVSPALQVAVDVMYGTYHKPSMPNRIFAAIRAAHARRAKVREYEALLLCDDHILKDIGLTRGAVREALAACRR